MNAKKEIVKSKRKIILIGQFTFILMIGIILNKTIKVNTESPYQDEIIPYTSSFEAGTLSSRIVSTNQVSRGSVLRNAEDVWADQEYRFLDAEDRYSNTELAQMIIDGETTRAERIINIDQYIKKDIDKEVDKLKATKKAEEIKALKLTNQGNTTNTTKISDTKNAGDYKIIKAIPYDTTFKSYMPWTALSPKYAQGKLLAKATPDPATAIMTYEGRYLVALGFAYADTVGEKIDIVMENGTIIPVMIGDFKATEDTDANQSITVHDGSIVEFIVSSNSAAAEVVNQSGNYNTIFPGKIKEFRKLN